MFTRASAKRKIRDRALGGGITATTVRSFLPGTRLPMLAVVDTIFPCWSNDLMFETARRSHEYPVYASTPRDEVCCTMEDDALTRVQIYLIIARQASVPQTADLFDLLLKWAQTNAWPDHPAFGNPNVVAIVADDPNLDMLRQFQLACKPLPGIPGYLSTVCLLRPPSQGNALSVPGIGGGMIGFFLPGPPRPDDFIGVAVIIEIFRTMSSPTKFGFPGNRSAARATLTLFRI